jgi:hypothetical protein
MKTGAWINAGRQDARGLTPASLFSFIISSDNRCLSSLYFSRSCFIRGWIACILSCDSICFMNGLNRIARSVKIRKITLSTQVIAWSGPRTAPKILCQTHMIPDTG